MVRAVRASVVDCPHCKQKAGMACVSPKKKPMIGIYHYARVREFAEQNSQAYRDAMEGKTQSVASIMERLRAQRKEKQNVEK